MVDSRVVRWRLRFDALDNQLASLPTSLARADPANLMAAEGTARSLHRALSTEVVSVLGATLMFGDSDGDSCPLS